MFAGARWTLGPVRLVLLLASLSTLPLLAPPAVAQSLPGTPDPTLLPAATTLQVPLTLAYDALNVPSLAAGTWYLDPTTQIKIYKLTSATYPASSANWGHDYAEGGDEVSLPYNGNTRAVLVRQNGGVWWLVDFTPGGGVSNPRQLTGNLAPFMDLAFTFSNNPATPYYAYVSSGSVIRRFDIRTMTEAPGNGWPVTGETLAMWLHQSENDGFFVWMRGANGSTIVGYEPSTGTLKTYTNANLNEPRIDRAGRYVGISMTGNGLTVWDWQTNSVLWSTPGDPGIPFAHNASLRRRWLTVDWNMSYPPDYAMFTPDLPNSGVYIGGPANGTTIHGNGNWIQQPANLDDQWAVFTHYGSLRPAESFWLAPGGMVLITPNGERRLLGHPYNTTANYTFYSFAKFSPDGKYVLFTSDMNSSGRSDVFLAELAQIPSTPDITLPTVSITAPASGATVSGAITVSADASDDVGVVGVQFTLDGANLDAEDTSAPYSISWNTTTVANGSHTLTAVARDAAGHSTTSSPVTVTVSNLTGADTTPPVVTAVAASVVTSSDAVITWTTDEPSDSQVEYGPTTAYGSVTALNTSMVTSHSETLSGLAASTLYHYQVKSRDAAGNLATSADFTFTTLSPPPGAGLDTGLVGHWKLDEGSGTLSGDASGNGHSGTLLNGPTWTAGRSGQAVSFDGVDDYIEVPHTSALNAYPLTVALWLKTNTTAGVRGLVNKYVAGSYNGYQVFMNAGNLCAWYIRDTANYAYDGGGCTLSTAGYNDNQWHHVVFVVDAAGGRLYVDGTQRASQGWTGTAGAPSTLQPLHLAHYPGAFGGTEYLPGVLDDVRIYNRALSAEEVGALYNAGGPTLQGVIWTNLVNATATGNSLQKTAGCDGCPDAGATSQQQIAAGDGYLEFTASETTAMRFAGLSNGNAGTSADEIKFAVRLQAGIAEVRESGLYRADTTFVSGDVFRIAAEAGIVKYSKNGTLFYTSTIAPTYPLIVDASLLNLNGTITNAVIFGGSTGTAADTTPPIVSMTAPANGTTVSGTTTVSADASDNVGVVGVQFTLDGANFGPEDTTSPYSITWDTATATNGSHILAAVARDAAGNSTTSAAITVTVNNDSTPPVISLVSVSAISSSGATITWTTDEPSDSQVEYGPTTAYGSVTPLDTSLVTAHSQTLSGLAPGTLYHYRVKSKDAVGNLATSADFTFTTLVALVGYWTFDEGSGTTATDSSGNGNTGTLVNGPTWTAGKINRALSFDGSNDYVSVPHRSSLNAYPLTVAVWMKTKTTSLKGLVNKYSTSSFNGYQVFVNSGNLCAWYFRDASNYIWDGSGCTLNTAGYTDNQWHHVVFVVDASGGRLYVDGVQRASRPWTGTPGPPSTTLNLSFARYPGITSPYFRGVLDDVRIYNGALSGTDVVALYNAADITPPVISAVSASNISSSGATITWTTNEASDSQVEYGPTTAYGSSTPLNPTMVTAHSETLSGLTASTLYHYRVKSRDAAGNLAVSADFTFTTAASTPSVENVIWTNLVNVTATGNSLQKTSGCDGCPDAGATSQQQIAAGDGYLEFTASETTAMRFAGLSNGNAGTSADEIKFAIRLQAGIAEVRETGLYRTDTTFVSGDVFRIAVASGVVKYFKNGVVFYTSAVVPTYPMLVDSAILNLNGTISNAVILRTP